MKDRYTVLRAACQRHGLRFSRSAASHLRWFIQKGRGEVLRYYPCTNITSASNAVTGATTSGARKECDTSTLK